MISASDGPRQVIKHVAGCPGSGRTARVLARVEHLRKTYGAPVTIVVITCSRATAACLTTLLAGRATILLHSEIPAYSHATRDEQAHLVLHDSHRLSEGALRTILIQLRPSSVVSVGAAPFSCVGTIAELGWCVEERVVTHSFRVPAGHMQLVNSLLSAQDETNVLIESARSAPEPTVPVVYVGEHLSHMKREMATHIKTQIANGAARDSIALICPDEKTARSFSTQLMSAGVPALAQDDGRYLKDLNRVLWLAHGAMKRAVDGGDVWIPADRDKMALALGEEWPRLEEDCLKLRSRRMGLDAVFKECARLYLRAKGGANAKENQGLRAFFGSWEPLCLDDACTPSELRDLVRTISGADHVSCITPHASRGSEWKHVVIGGLDDGVWKRRGDYRGKWGAEALELMLLACSRASESLTIFVSGPDGPLGPIEGLTGKLPEGAVRIEWLDEQDS